MDTKKLQAILSTVKIGSINKAAESLGYTQSGLTYMINSIEEEIGVPLLHRCHSGIHFTDMGLELLPYIEDMIKSEQAFSAKVDSIKRRSIDRIIIGAYPSVAIAWIPDAIKAFEERYPDTKVEIKLGHTDISLWLETDKIHFGIVEKAQAEKYHFEYLCDDYMYAAVPKSLGLSQQETVTLEQLAREKLIYSVRNHKNVVVSAFRELGIETPHAIDVSTVNGMDLLFMVSRDMGVSFLSSLYLNSCPSNVAMIPISPPLKRTIGVISKGNKTSDPKIAYLLKALRCYSKHPAKCPSVNEI